MLFTGLGSVDNPLGRNFNDPGGLVGLGTSVIRLIIVAAGVFALFNFITAGVDIISSQGDPKSMEAAKQKIFMSVLGLVLIAASFMLAALAGLIIYGQPGVFLNPTIYGN